MPIPKIKRGKWFKERERTKSGRWRKKRSDADKPRKKKHSIIKYTLALIGVLVIIFLIVYFMFPEWLKGFDIIP